MQVTRIDIIWLSLLLATLQSIQGTAGHIPHPCLAVLSAVYQTQPFQVLSATSNVTIANLL